jgi:hypothetical protein
LGWGKKFTTPARIAIEERGVFLKILLIQDWNDFLNGFEHSIVGTEQLNPRNA